MKLKSINPHDQSIVGELIVSTQVEVKKVVKKAKKAFTGWENLQIEDRVAYIEKFREKVAENREKIAKLTTLKMGGSSPGIIFADADLDLTMENLYWGRFLNCGQVCTAIKRLFVERPVYQKVVGLFIEKLKTVKVGNPLKKDTDIGPLVSKKQLETLKSQVADAVSKGAKVEVGGQSKRLLD